MGSGADNAGSAEARGEPDPTTRRFEHVGENMPGIESRNVHVLDDAADTRDGRTSEDHLGKEGTRIFLAICGNAAAAEAGGMRAPLELEPVSVQQSILHPDHVGILLRQEEHYPQR